MPALTAETRFPLGLFRAWTVWRPAAQLLVYPQPERDAPRAAGRAAGARRAEPEPQRRRRRDRRRARLPARRPAEAGGLEEGREGVDTGGELVSRDTSASARQELWLDWAACPGLAPEDRLSRLAAWVLAADRAGADYGLRLPGLELAPADGDAQRRRCLEALALWR